MKRSVKNAIMIGMATVLIGTSAVTFSYARDNSPRLAIQSQSQQFEKRDKNGSSQGNPIDNFGKDSQSDKSDTENSQDSQQFGQRPQAPTNDSQKDGSQNSQQPPEMQGDGSQNSQQPPEMQGNNNQNSQQPPSLPDGEQPDGNELPKEEGTSSDSEELNVIGTATDTDSAEITDAANKMPSHIQRKSGSDTVSVLCYLFGAFQVGIIIAIIAYLIVSKFNKISFNKLFGSKASIKTKQ